jgi:RND superfamily putative drug exporter
VVGVPFLTQMGLGASFTVAISVVIALTLLPALLGFAGRRVLGKKAKPKPTHKDEVGFGTRWARAIAKRPVAALLIAVVGLVPVASGGRPVPG